MLLNVRIFNKLENVEFRKRFNNSIEWMIWIPNLIAFFFLLLRKRKM